MKISSEAQELQIEVYSGFLFRLWGLVFIAAGLVFLLPILVQYRITCEDKGYNKANQCTLTTSFLLFHKQKINLGELKSATISNLVDGRSDTIYYCLLLLSTEGYTKIPNIQSKRNFDIAVIVEKIDSYIKTSLHKSIRIPKAEAWWSYVKVLLFFFLGFGSLLFRLITIYFNKKTKTITIACKNIINTQETHILFKDVDHLLIEEHGKRHKEFSLALILKNGEHRPLPGVHDSILKHIEDLAQQLSDKMGIKMIRQS